ncbi:cell wall-binding repeat-containing protein [Desulfosporosinus sp. FKA]|uniref:cell wall-binding repeat-containing protein n=1 Tax=Desulfosporosinus sp. FKA TaxID=1969834 RepID=UPI000B49C661|nr:cell wall-binding repeat-containing protein [Desulfosporosinus sp. FKA]
MRKKTKQVLLKGCLAAAVALSTTLAPVVANAAVSNATTTAMRIGGADQYATAAQMAEKGWPGTSDSVVISSGMDYALVDALAAGPLAATLKAPILLTDNGAALNPSTKEELLRLKPKKAYITSGASVIEKSVLNEIQGMGITPVQLGGTDQYDTSVNIAREMVNQNGDVSQIVLAAGWVSPADALSIAPIAAAQGMPILTTTRDELPGTVKTFLDSIKSKVKDSYVVGGTAVVSDKVKGELAGTVQRFSGLTKYDTNKQILKGLSQNYRNKSVYVASGESLVDALAGVPLAAASQSPFLLVNRTLDNETEDFVKLNLSTSDMTVLGGESVVPSAEINELTSAVTYTADNAAIGSTDSKKPAELTDNIVITGDNVTLKNAEAKASVYVQGNNVTLSNLNVQGTVFVDPGKNGSAKLDGVTAGNIVVLSGAAHSVTITNSTVSGGIIVSSNNDTSVVFSGTTVKAGVTIQTYEVYETDAQGKKVKTGTIMITNGTGDSLGSIMIVSERGQTTAVNLSGEFKQPITVGGQGEVDVTLESNTKIDNMKTETKAMIKVPVGSSIGSLDFGTTGTLTSGGGNVNGKMTSSSPSTPPTKTSDTSTIINRRNSEGGGGNSEASAKISTVAINNGTPVTVNGTSYVYDLSTSSNSTMIRDIEISAVPAHSTLVLTQISSSKTGVISGTVISPTNPDNSLVYSNQTFTLPGTITMSNIFGNLITNGDISVGSLRALFGTSVTFTGTLSSSGKSSSTVTLTINLGASKK